MYNIFTNISNISIRWSYQTGKCLQNIPHKKKEQALFITTVLETSYTNKKQESDNLLFKKSVEKYQMITGKFSSPTMSQRSLTTYNTDCLSIDIR